MLEGSWVQRVCCPSRHFDSPTSYGRFEAVCWLGGSGSLQPAYVRDAERSVAELRRAAPRRLSAGLRSMSTKTLRQLHKLTQTLVRTAAAVHIQAVARGARVRRQQSLTRQLPRRKERPCCIVFGSLNIDLKGVSTSQWGEAGRTTVGTFCATPGGKGTNEAIALSRLGVPTSLIGLVGDDEMGTILLRHLSGEAAEAGTKLDIAHVRQLSGSSTGVSVIIVCEDGSKSTVVCEGANNGVGDNEAQRVVELLHGSAMLLALQLELPLEPMATVGAAARQQGMLTVLRASPLPPAYLPKAEALLHHCVDWCFLNEWEAPALLGRGWTAPLVTAEEAEHAAQAILLRFPQVRLVLVTCCVAHVLCERPARSLRARERSKGAVSAPTSAIPAVAAPALSSGLNHEPQTTAAATVEGVTVSIREAAVLDATGWQRRWAEAIERTSIAGGLRVRQVVYKALSVGHGSFTTMVLPRRKRSLLDVIGAADALVGGFVAAHCHGLSTQQKLLWGSAAADLCAERRGAALSMPREPELVAHVAAELQRPAAEAADSARSLGRAMDRSFQQNALHMLAIRGTPSVLPTMLETGGSATALLKLARLLQQPDAFGFLPEHRAVECVRLHDHPIFKTALQCLAVARLVLTAAGLFTPLASPQSVMSASDRVAPPDASKNDAAIGLQQKEDIPEGAARGLSERAEAEVVEERTTNGACSLVSAAEMTAPEGSELFATELPLQAAEAATCAVISMLRRSTDCGRPETAGTPRAAENGPSDACVPVIRRLAMQLCMPFLDKNAGLGHSFTPPPPSPAETSSRTSDKEIQEPSAQALALRAALAQYTTEESDTLMLAAAAAGLPALVQAALAAGADPTARTSDGESAMHSAVRHENREVLRLLLVRTSLPITGPNALDVNGFTPLDLCSPSFREEVEAFHEALRASVPLIPRRSLTRRGSNAPSLVVDQYEVYEQVGAKVQLAEDTLTHTAVCLKYYADLATAEREASTMRLVGPDTAPEVYRLLSDHVSGQHILVMEAADAQSELSQVCARRHGATLDSERLELRATAQRLLRCVRALHDHGLVHGDIKPKHFMRFSGMWKLIDYDSVLAEGTERVPHCTVRFAAPEVARARVNGVTLQMSSAVDVWALGLVLFHLFTGNSFWGDVEVDERTLAETPQAVVARLKASQKLNRQQKRLLAAMLVVDPVGRQPLPELLARGFFKLSEDTEQAKRIEVLAMFSSPRRRRGGQALPQLKLMREIMSMQEAIPRRQREIRPAAHFPADIAPVLRQLEPRIIQFSGHGDAVRCGPFAGALAFELADGTLQLPNPDDFIALLAPEICPRLECVFLNGCRTLHPLGSRIVEALPHLTVLGWSTISADAAAAAFARGFYDAIGRGCTVHAHGSSKTDISEAYTSAELCFKEERFVYGDPEGANGRQVHGQYGILGRSARYR